MSDTYIWWFNLVSADKKSSLLFNTPDTLGTIFFFKLIRCRTQADLKFKIFFDSNKTGKGYHLCLFFGKLSQKMHMNNGLFSKFQRTMEISGVINFHGN